ncbi:hypothetical protein INR49_011187 [Caranx melampygus]|nr:hypothetical protein INR49_011187 [Caranx melampygus]
MLQFNFLNQRARQGGRKKKDRGRADLLHSCGVGNRKSSVEPPSRPLTQLVDADDDLPHATSYPPSSSIFAFHCPIWPMPVLPEGNQTGGQEDGDSRP